MPLDDTALEALAEVLGGVVAEKRREFDEAIARIVAVRDAETKAFQAEVRLMVREALDAVATRVAALKDGLDGKDGLPGAEGPVGPQGPPGPSGEQGPEGIMGLQGPSGADGVAGVAGPEGPRGEQGPEGIMGLQGITGADGKAGPKGDIGDPGRDGMHGRDGLNGLQGERGIAGKDGRDGTDGAGFDMLGVEFDEDRKQLTVRFGAGERVKEFPVFLPIPMFRGKWNTERGAYSRGDEVLFGGQVFRAVRDTAQKPGPSSDHWEVAASRGRDGRDGKDGAQGPQGPEGKPGRDLTQLGPDGAKW